MDTLKIQKINVVSPYINYSKKPRTTRYKHYSIIYLNLTCSTIEIMSFRSSRNTAQGLTLLEGEKSKNDFAADFGDGSESSDGSDSFEHDASSEEFFDAVNDMDEDFKSNRSSNHSTNDEEYSEDNDDDDDDDDDDDNNNDGEEGEAVTIVEETFHKMMGEVHKIMFDLDCCTASPKKIKIYQNEAIRFKVNGTKTTGPQTVCLRLKLNNMVLNIAGLQGLRWNKWDNKLSTKENHMDTNDDDVSSVTLSFQTPGVYTYDDSEAPGTIHGSVTVLEKKKKRPRAPIL